MKKYVFLTLNLEGLSGNPRYVNFKCGWLKQQGWEPLVFWSFDKTRRIELENTKQFSDKKFIFNEMNFFPSWFTQRKRNAVINSIVETIGEADEIVIESNKLQLAAWGELIAEKINAKHICFVTTEKLVIQNRTTFDICYAKLQRGEFFSINQPAIKLLFSKYIEIKEPEKYYWSAMMGVDVEEIPFPPFDNLPKADFTITHFGRTKGYFSYMTEEMNRFISQHPDKTFNLFFLGQIKDEDSLINKLASPNVNIVLHPPISIIPAQVFLKSDLVIGAAGCAWISANNGGKTISMDVNRNVPLGLLRYTTLDSNAYSGKYQNEKSLSQWLETILINKEKFTPIELLVKLHDFEYQMQYLTQPDGRYFDTTLCKEPITRNDWLWILISKIGLFRLVDYYYYKRLKIKRNLKDS